MKNYLEYKNYIGTVNYANEDRTFYGKIEGINDLMLFEGQTVNELEKVFKDAVIDYLETCKEINKEPNKVYKGVFNVRIDPKLHKKVYQKALKAGISLNAYVQQALKNEVLRHA